MGDLEPRPSDDLRASDSERDEVVELLREQAAAGRLTLTEFEERLDDVYSARTRSELQHALRELPVRPASVARSGPGSDISDAEVRAHYRRRMRKQLSEFAVPNLICNAIWVMSGAGYWWPGWVLLGTGVGVVGGAIRGFDPDEERERMVQQRRAAAMAEIEQDARSQRP